jgi:hypothetical protein
MPAANSFLRYPSHQKKLLLTAILILWLVTLFRVFSVLGPDSDHTSYNSDGAIPIIMANDQRPITIFDYYYYAAGRWGGWPMITARLINHSTGYRWTPESFNAVRAVWLFVGILVLALLNKRHALFIVIAGLSLICLDATLRKRLFDSGQVYAWQITALILAWYSLRRLLSEDLDGSSGKKLFLRRALWGFLLFWFSLLSIWSSFASGPFLFFLAVLEVAYSRLRTGPASFRAWRTKRYLWSFVLVCAAILSEYLMRRNYYRHGLKHYRSSFETALALDVGFLKENFYRQLINLTDFSLWPLLPLMLLVVLVVAGSFVYFRLKRREDLLTRSRNIVLDETVVLIAGSFGIAVLNFVPIVFVDHVRLNDYDNRFLTVTFLFGGLSGLLTLYLATRALLTKAKLSKYGIPALLSVGVLLLLVGFPTRKPNELYQVEKETALALANKLPHAYLMGGYWATYLFAPLLPKDTLIPLPREGELERMPWTIGRLRDEKFVLVEYGRSNTFATHTPPEQLNQYGNRLRLVDPEFYKNDPYEFALYVNTTN